MPIMLLIGCEGYLTEMLLSLSLSFPNDDMRIIIAYLIGLLWVLNRTIFVFMCVSRYVSVCNFSAMSAICKHSIIQTSIIITIQLCEWKGKNSVSKPSPKPFSTHVFMLYAFIQHVFIMCPLCGGYCLRSQGPSREQDRPCSRLRHQSSFWQLHLSQQLGLLTSQPVWAAPWCKISKIPSVTRIGPFQGQYIIAKASPGSKAYRKLDSCFTLANLQWY